MADLQKRGTFEMNCKPVVAAADWAKLVDHTIHSVKVAIVEALHWIRCPLSATALAEMLEDGGFSFDSVHYHLGALAKMEVVEEASSGPTQGGRERFYVLSRSD